ncbi:hypothetical protein BH09MYX1_BH09MYX1_36150 [soil metagenome]
MVRILVFTLSVCTISALFHAVVYRWAIAAYPRLVPYKRYVLGVIGLLVVSGPAMRFIAHGHRSTWTSALFAATMIELLIVMVSTPMIFLVRVAGSVGARVARRRGEPEAKALSRRQVIEAVGGTAALATTTMAFGWGAVRGRHAFELEEVAVRLPNLPKALDGYTIVQISDVHVGSFVQERELDDGYELIARVKPDLIVVTGDMIDFDPAVLPTWTRAIQRMSARDGVVTILGNHDYYTGADRVRSAIEGVGARVLVNHGMLSRAGDGGGFALLGVDDASGAQNGGPGPNLESALRDVPPDRARILLSHQPRTLDLWAGKVDLQLSGHTHGGQVNSPGGLIRPADALFRYVSGRYERSGTTLWVNRGFGVAGPPVRIGAPPEVTKIVLVSG